MKNHSRHRRLNQVSRPACAVLLAAVLAAPAGLAHATNVYDSWYGLNSTWSAGGNWSGGMAPNNVGTTTFDAVVAQGVPALDIDATVNGFYLYGSAQLAGNHTLTINNVFQWTGGYIGYVNASPTVNVAAGATVTLDTPPATQGTPARLLFSTINSYGTTNYTGGGTLYISSGASYNNYGTFNLSAPNGIQYSNGQGTVANQAGATFNKLGTTSSSVTANFTNAGLLAVSEGSLLLETVTNNAGGAISVAPGTTLTLRGTTSNYLVGSDLSGGGAVSFVFGTHNFAVDTFHPTGAVSIAANATVNVKNTFTPSSLDTLAGTLNTDADQSFNNATLTGHLGGTGIVTFGNNFAWSGGTLDRASITTNGHTAIAAGAQAAFNAVNSVTSNRIIDNAGTITHTGAIVNLNNGGTLNNTGAFYANGSGGIGTSFSPGYVNNSGAFDLIAPVNYTVGVIFNNTGTVNIDAGTLSLTGGGSNASAINVRSGATLKIDSSLTHSAGSTITGAGNLLFNSAINDLSNTIVSTTGTLTLATNSTATFANTFSPSGTVNVAGTLVLNTSASSTAGQSYSDLTLTGTLSGSRDLTITNHLDWTTAVSSNVTGTGHLVVASGALADVGGTTRIASRPIDNLGTVNDTAGTFNLNSGSTFNNAGTFNLAGGSNLGNSSGNGTFNNSGTLNKSGTTTSTISVPLNNAATGTVNLNGGTLVLAGGGTNSGTIIVDSGATLRFGAGMSHVAGSAITGAGNLDFSSGMNDLTNALVSTTGTFGVQSNASATIGNVIAPAGTVTVAGTLVDNKTAASSGEQTFDQLVFSGTLGGSRDVRVSGHLTWANSSTITGTGKLTLGSSVTTDIDGTAKAIGRAVDNYGTMNHTAGSFNVNLNGAVANYGTFNAISSSGISNNSGLGTFANYGTFEKTGTAVYSIGVPFTNGPTGVVNIDAGSLTIAGGGTDSGQINLAAGTLLTYSQTVTHNAGSLVSGSGGVAFTSGTHTFPSGTFNPTGPVTFGSSATVTLNNTITPSSVGTITGNVTFNADQSFSDVMMAGSIGGTGNLTFSGTFNWQSSTMSGTGTTTLPAGTTWTMSNNSGRTLSRPLDSSAATTWSAGTVTVTSGATVTNRGTFDASTTGFNSQSGGGTFNNVGTFTKSGTTTFSFPSGVTLLNNGTVNVNQGILTLQGSGTDSGTINVAPGATLRLDTNASTYAAASLLTGSGSVEFNGAAHVFPAGTYAATGPLTVASGASLTVNNVIAPSSIAPIAGTLNVNANQTFSNLTLTGNGTLGGSGDFLVTGTFAFNGGTLGGTGKADFQVGSTLDMSANAARSLSRKLNTGGTVNYSAGNVTFYGTTWQLSSGINVTGSNFLGWSASGGSTNTVYNTGGINLNMAPTAEFNMGSGITLDSISVVNVTSGKLTLGATPAQLTAGGALNGGTWWVGNAGNLNFAVGPNVTTIGANAIVTLDGAGSKFDKLNSLARNDGSLTFSTSRAFTATAALNNTGSLTVSGNAVLATAALTNSGQITVTSGGTLTTGGTATGTGTLAIAAGSTMTVANGLTQTGGSLIIEGTVNHTGGSSTISPTTTQAWWDGSALNVTGGSLTFASDAGAYYPNPYLALSVSGTGTLRTASQSQRLKSLSVSTGGNAIMTAGSQSTLFARTLALTGTGTLDLNDNKLAVDDLADGRPTLSLFRQYLSAGRLFSSTANADPQHRMAIGYADASDLGATTWGSLLVYGGTTLAKVTWLGDANLDGRINADDYALLDRAYAKVVTDAHWTDGDFNYDGQVTSADYLLIDRVVMQQSGTLSPSLLAQRESQFGPTYVTELLAALPEPTSTGLLLVGLPLLGRRRRGRLA